MILVYLLCHLRVTDSPPSLGKFGIDIEHTLIEQTDLKTCRSIEKTREWLSQLSGCTRQTLTVHREKLMKRIKLISSTFFLVLAICSTTTAGNISTRSGNISVDYTGNISTQKAKADSTIDQGAVGYYLLGILSVLL